MRKIIYILIISLTSLFNINIPLTPDASVATNASLASAIEYPATLYISETAITF